MKKSISIVLSILILVCTITLLPFTASALTRSEFDNKLNNLRSKYPNYSTWYESFDGGSECFGFARLMGYEVFGSYPSSWEVSRDFNSVKVGDIVRYGNNGNGGHSIFVTNVSGNTITFVDCNGNGNYSGATKVRRCGIKWDNTTTIGSSLFGYSFSYIRKSPDLEIKVKPYNVSISADKLVYGLYDNIELSFASEGNTEYYGCQIWSGDKLIFSQNTNENKLIISCRQLGAGNYAAYVSAVNSVGNTTSSTINFYIANQLSNPILSINKTAFKLNDTIKFTAAADGGADYYGLQIWKYDTVVYQKEFIGHTIEVPCDVIGEGEFGAFVSCVNATGSVNTQVVSFTISSNKNLGDTNNDGIISVEDTTEIQKYIANMISFDDETMLRADVNEDGEVDVNDTTLIQEYCAGIISEF